MSTTAGVVTATPGNQHRASTTSPIADPLPIAFGVFAFTLAVFGVRYVGVSASSLNGPTSAALDYAILIGGIAEIIGGVLAVIRGVGYSGWVSSIFGIWLVGFFLLIGHNDPAAASDSGIVTTGADGKALADSVTSTLQTVNTAAWHASSVAWYALVLFIPVLLLAIPAVLGRNIPFIVAFVAVLGMIVLFGSAYLGVYSTLTDVTRGRATEPDLSTPVDLLRVSGYLAFVAAAAIWWVFLRTVLEAHRADARAHAALG
ncbi:MAG: GPR1/FUN34/YaaH family transporter [Nocardioides sp.]|uniref:hypothetical protein n=1 Tax=Nocardioides sp. TaxID=35761 RepID=UPI0039E32CD6